MYSPPICCACFQGTMRWIAVAALAAVLAVASAHGARVGRGQWVNSAAARDTGHCRRVTVQVAQAISVVQLVTVRPGVVLHVHVPRPLHVQDVHVRLLEPVSGDGLRGPGRGRAHVLREHLRQGAAQLPARCVVFAVSPGTSVRPHGLTCKWAWSARVHDTTVSCVVAGAAGMGAVALP